MISTVWSDREIPLAPKPSRDLAASVAVIIPTFNSALCIERALKSVFDQTTPVSKIIIIDDCSTDDTIEVVQRFAQGCLSLTVIKLNINQGPSAARNIGIRSADTDWVALLDADDAWKSDRIEFLLSLAQKHAADFVADNQIFYDLAAGQEVPGGFQVTWDYQIVDVETLFQNDIIEITPLVYSNLKPMMRTAFLKEKNISYNESLRSGEDFFLYAEMIFSGAHAVLTNRAMYIYSTRFGAVSKTFNPASRTVARFDLVIEAHDVLASRYSNEITPAIKNAMRARRRRLQVIQDSNIARLLRARSKVGFCLYTIRRPQLLFLYLGRMKSKILKS